MKFPLIQIYRAIAALMVVLFHMISNTSEYYHTAFFGTFFKFGYLGVDYFFVLSGFIITYTHFDDIVNKRNFNSYFKKRLIRIYPIYWVIATISLLSYIFLTHGYIKSMNKTIQLNSFEDITYLLRCYVLIPGKLKFFLMVAWTLSFELLFYLVFSICILRGINTTYAFFIIWIALILLNNYVFHFSGIIAFFTHFYVLEFLFGCFVAFLIIKKFYISISMLSGLIAFSLLSLLLSYRFYGNSFSDRYLFTYLLLGFNASLLILFSTRFKQFQNQNIITKAGILIGDSSYSVYLSHIFFIALLGRLFTKKVLLLQLEQWQLNIFITVIFLLVILGGVVMHLFVEKPLLNFLHSTFIKKKNRTLV
jgi:peptidoglycan/LPS O-acetylase OafA/YrhL